MQDLINYLPLQDDRFLVIRFKLFKLTYKTLVWTQVMKDAGSLVEHMSTDNESDFSEDSIHGDWRLTPRVY